MPTAEREDGVASTTGDSSIVETMIRRCGQFATLPAIAKKIIEIADDPLSTWEDLRQVITIDPAFGVRLLKLVNSPYYGLPRPVGTLHEALALLGFRAVKNVAISTSLGKLFHGGRICASFDASELWTHSIAVATATQLLSRSTNVSSDEAFVAGLMHDVGILVELHAQATTFASMTDRLDANHKLTFRCAENLTFGTTHEALGLAVCEAWRFPANLSFAAGFHHRPWELVAAKQMLPTLIYVADILAARQSFGYSRTVESLELSPEVLSLATLNEPIVTAVEAALPDAVAEACRILVDG
jgi:HD-like signal output (HDOD) protein